MKQIRQPLSHGVARVPVVMQMEALECGAASLAMILAYYGRWIPLEQMREDCGISRDGAKASNILKAARSYGLDAGGYRMEPEALRKNGTFPCVVHWNFNHFVVCCGFRGNQVILNDPARGRCQITIAEFDKCFTGVVLAFAPTPSFQPGGKPPDVLRFAADRLRGTGSAILFVALTMLIVSLTDVLRQGLSRVFLDELLPGREPGWVTPFLILLGAVSLAEVTAAWMNAVYSLRINGKMAAAGNTSFLWHLLHLPMKFFSQRLAGDLLQRKTSNAAVAYGVIRTIAPLVLHFAMLVFYLIVMLRYSVLLSVIGIAAVALNLAVSRFISARRINITRVLMRDSGKLAAATVSGIDMIETIKASGAEDGYFRKWAGYQASVNTQNTRYAVQQQYLALIPAAINSLANIGVQILGVYLVLRGAFTVGMVMAFQGFLASFSAPAQTMIVAGQTIQELRTQMERISDVMQYPADVQEEQEITDFSKLSGAVELRHVTFGYSRLSPPLIEDFSMTLRPGGSVALVGASGCGKSTLSKLIAGLYAPWEGEITFDGKPLRTIPHSIFTSSLAVVDQDIILFEDTIANNIRMWDNSIEDFEVIMAARDAQLHEDIMRRDGGYEYRLTEGGKDFSGGQRQRLEIARVLAKDPTVVIMDEATSALDARTEYNVVQAIRDRGISCIVIAHRLSTIRDCDEIIVLDHGRVVERGTHQELMDRGGAYCALVMSE